jgi:Flp pilus assembly protein TadB
MHWQDGVFFIGQIIFVFALIPTIKGKSKPALSSSVITGLILTIFALTYLSLDLWFSAVAATATSASWWVLAYQKYRQDKK